MSTMTRLVKDYKTLIDNEDVFVELESLLSRVSSDMVRDSNTASSREKYNAFVDAIQTKTKELTHISTTP
jgi:hypothetical protein